MMIGIDRAPLIDRLIEALENQPRDSLWVPYPVSQFLDGLAYLNEQRPGCKFLEIGSGTGSKLFLAQLAGFEATGIEPFVKTQIAGLNVIDTTAEEFDKYSEYDVIYQGGIIDGLEVEQRLEADIIAQVQPWALLFWPLSQVPAQHGWHELIRGVWGY